MKIVDMRPGAFLDAVTEAAAGATVAYSTLGVDEGTANMTAAQQRAIDVELNQAFAEGCKAAGVQPMVFSGTLSVRGRRP